MELYAKGQLSYLILTCMQDRDFYGLDIISEISDRSCGRINLKKPSVYSNLTRMEKQGYISSYLKSSDVGPNRKYYSLTEKGRNFYAELQEYFDRNNIDVFKDFSDGETQETVQSSIEEVQPSVVEEVKETAVFAEAPVNEDETEENEFFNFSFDEEYSENIEPEQENVEENAIVEDEVAFVREEEIQEESPAIIEEINEETFVEDPVAQDVISPAADNTVEQTAVEEKEETRQETKNDAVFLKNDEAIEYNKRLYDISKDLNKYRKKRSFAEDQISMTTTSPLVSAQEKQKSNLEDFKSALTANKLKYQDKRLNQEDFTKQMQYRYERPSIFEKAQGQQPVSVVESKKDDSLYITKRISESEVEKAKKIEPPRLKPVVSELITREPKLPAPKRDASIDPSHKEILSKLYAKTRDHSTTEAREDSIYDYNDLKDYYNNQNISFNIYKKSARREKHNTNKLYLMTSIITFLFACGMSALVFGVLALFGILRCSTVFMYYLLPALLILDVMFKIYKVRKSSGWIPKRILPAWMIWGLFLLAVGAIVGLNFAAGFNGTNFIQFSTPLILPTALAFVVIVVRYYIKRILFVKFWR